MAVKRKMTMEEEEEEDIAQEPFLKNSKCRAQALLGQFFSSPDLFDNLHTKPINCCGTVRLN
jgi:hypothetical protein